MELILGFLGAGKSSFINSVVRNEELYNGKVIVIQEEQGEEEIQNEYENIIIVKENNINLKFIENIIEEYNPCKMYIECNGMKDPENIINIFYKKIIKDKCRLDDIVSIIDCKTFEMYFKNMQMFVANHIYNSNWSMYYSCLRRNYNANM